MDKDLKEDIECYLYNIETEEQFPTYAVGEVDPWLEHIFCTMGAYKCKGCEKVKYMISEKDLFEGKWGDHLDEDTKGDIWAYINSLEWYWWFTEDDDEDLGTFAEELEEPLSYVYCKLGQIKCHACPHEEELE